MASRRCGDLPQDLFSLLCPNLLRGLLALSVHLLVMLVSRVDGEAHPRVDERPSQFQSHQVDFHGRPSPVHQAEP